MLVRRRFILLRDGVTWNFRRDPSKLLGRSEKGIACRYVSTDNECILRVNA